LQKDDAQLQLAQAQTILVTFLMQLGDLILTTPFITALRNAAPNAKIVYLMDEKWLDIMKANPDIDEILTIDRKGKDNSFSALWRYSRKLRKRKFDFLINLNPSERCTFLAAFSGAKYKAGATPKAFRPFFDKVIKLDHNKHAADRFLEVLQKLGVKNLVHDGLKIVTTEKQRKEADNFFTSHNITSADKVIGFNIGSASMIKCWLPERFAQVADQMIEDGYKVVFLGSKAEKELVQKAVSHMKHQPIIATGNFTVGVLVAVIHRLNLLITNDSGPMHMAVSQKTPIVALFGPSNPERFGPYQAKNTIVVTSQTPCSDCPPKMKKQCEDWRCMKGISVQQVVDAARSLLTNYID